MFAAFTSQMRRARHTRRQWTAHLTALAVIVVLVAAPSAQQAGFSGSSGAVSGELASEPTDINLLVGRSTILNVGSPIQRVSLTVPDVADALVTAPSQILIHGKAPGTISLFVWDRAGAIKTYEVNVRRDLNALKEQLKQLFPGEQITVLGTGKDVVLSGTVSGQYVVDKAAEVASGYVDKKDNVVNLLKQQEGVASNQIMLRVRFAEVSRSALQELGASFVASGRNEKWFGRTTTQQFAAPEWDQDGKLVFSDFLNLFIFNSKEGLGGVVRALQNKGLFQSLAEPNLIATNGKEASFLAGGEYPYPVVQPGAAGNAVSITFKEFGVRLSFTPTVLGGDLIHLKVKPEVSALDFSNAIVLEGFRVPALSTRRTETEVELRDGQTFAIAGLMNNTLTQTMSKIPGIGDIPILGLLFRSRAHQKNQTELVVMITPTIVRRGQMGVSEGLPSLVQPYLGKPDHALPNPDPYVGSPRYPATSSSRPRTENDGTPNTTPAPVNAAPTPMTKTAPKTNATPVTTTPPAGTLVPHQQPQQQQQPPQQQMHQQQPPQQQQPQVQPKPAPVKQPTKEELKAAERLREQQRKADEVAAKQREEDQRRQEEALRAAAKRAAEEKVRVARLNQERAKREAEVAKKNEAVNRKKAEEEAKRQRALAEAAERLKEAQAAYEAAKKGS